jgi:hypothetical protein
MDKKKRKSKKGRQYNDQNEKSKTMIKKTTTQKIKDPYKA